MAVERRFRRVAIVGLGLMGGSLARALRRLPRPPRIAASSERAEDLTRARADGVIDHAARGPDEAVADADLVVYAAPPDATLRLLETQASLWAADAVITDVTSVKRAVVERARAVGAAGRFAGSHPMAGGHGTGYGASRADLYDGARVWICATSDSPDGRGSVAGSDPRTGPRAAVAALWRAVGADPRVIDAEAHDEMVAWASHLPQVVSSALAGALAEAGRDPSTLGPGGRDATRLAASPPALWTQILRHNAELLAEPIEAVRRRLDGLAAALEAGDAAAVERWLEEARRWRAES